MISNLPGHLSKRNWQRQVTILVVSFLVGLILLSAQADSPQSIIKLDNQSVSQGALVTGKVIGSDWRIFVEGLKQQEKAQELITDNTGRFVFGVGRDQKSQINLILIRQDGQKQSIALPVKKRQWKVERVDGLPPQTVTPRKPEVLARIKREAAAVRQARNKSSQLEFFRQRFILPASGRISGVYGSQRILNGIPKRPHFGLDIANRTGTPVIAPADGVITLAEPDLFFSGGTLLMDHGYGVSSTFLHLSRLLVEKGQKVKKGQLIGEIGQTGRASGPHLDWRVNWFQVRLDPALLVQEQLSKM